MGLTVELTYRNRDGSASESPRHALLPSLMPASPDAARPVAPEGSSASQGPRPCQIRRVMLKLGAASLGSDEALLVNEFDVDGAGEEILGYEDDGDEGDEDEDEDDNDSSESESTEEQRLNSPRTFRKFKHQVRADAARRAEGNRRPGGLRTQRAMVRAWEVSCFYSYVHASLVDDLSPTGLC